MRGSLRNTPGSYHHQSVMEIRTLFENEATRVTAATMGLRYLRHRSLRSSAETSLDSLPKLVVQNILGMVANSHPRDLITPEIFGLVTGCKALLDGYRNRSSEYGSTYIVDRCECLYSLSEMLTQRNRLSERIRLLRECESLLPMASIASPTNEASCLPNVLASLSEALLRNGEVAAAAHKSRMAIQIFQLRVPQMTPSDWVAIGRALIVYCESCIFQRKFDEALSTQSVANTLFLECNDSDLTRPSLESIKKLVASYHGRRRVGTSSGARSRSASYSIVRPRRSQLGYDTARVVIEAPSSLHSGIQTDVTETVSRPASVPPQVGRQYIQSSSCENDWSVCQSRTSGKHYFYNSRTGESCWKKPHDN